MSYLHEELLEKTLNPRLGHVHRTSFVRNIRYLQEYHHHEHPVVNVVVVIAIYDTFERGDYFVVSGHVCSQNTSEGFTVNGRLIVISNE